MELSVIDVVVVAVAGEYELVVSTLEIAELMVAASVVVTVSGMVVVGVVEGLTVAAVVDGSVARVLKLVGLSVIGFAVVSLSCMVEVDTVLAELLGATVVEACSMIGLVELMVPSLVGGAVELVVERSVDELVGT